ncbi:MAG: InlB B-repeat-containing protein [Spirochaetota bacterium]
MVVKLGLEYGDLPAATRPGFAFGGWYTEPEGAGVRIVASTKVRQKASHTLYARWNLMPAKIAGTAALGTEPVFFELDMSEGSKKLKFFLPAEPGSYIQDGSIHVSTEEFELDEVEVNSTHYYISAKTSVKNGIFYIVLGQFSPEDGFFGKILKYYGSNIIGGGLLSGSLIFSNTQVQNYIGEATYLFETSGPKKLIFNALIDFDEAVVRGTWCEAGVGMGNIPNTNDPLSLHGALFGSLDKKTMSFDAELLPIFKEGLNGAIMTASGGGRFKNAHQDDISGYFNIDYMGMSLPSTLTAAKAP